jgi:hypothetical protein
MEDRLGQVLVRRAVAARHPEPHLSVEADELLDVTVPNSAHSSLRPQENDALAS